MNSPKAFQQIQSLTILILETDFRLKKECLKLNKVSAKRTKIELKYYEDDHRKIQRKITYVAKFLYLRYFFSAKLWE